MGQESTVDVLRTLSSVQRVRGIAGENVSQGLSSLEAAAEYLLF
jgi:hypothetical protein